MTLTVDSDLNGESPQFTLTCTSTGGPATTVTWTRDSETASGGMFSSTTVLNNAMTAQYTHTLTVTGRLGGQYQCTVSNNKPSQNSANFNVQGKGGKEGAREGGREGASERGREGDAKVSTKSGSTTCSIFTRSST